MKNNVLYDICNILVIILKTFYFLYFLNVTRGWDLKGVGLGGISLENFDVIY